MYYWEEKYENIWDYAPNPKRDKTRGARREALKCVCKETSLTEQLDKFVDMFVNITPPGVADVLRSYFKDEICCCTKNYCKHEDSPLPEDDLNDDLWEMYTFFLNEFNTMDGPKINVEHQPPETTSDLQNALQKARCERRNGARPDPDEPEAHLGLSAERAAPAAAVAPPTATNCLASAEEESDRWRSDACHEGGSLLQLSPYFKLIVMQMIMDCMKQRDVHRYFLLQHIRLLLHLHRSLMTEDDNSQS